eukprot:10107044-Heterocapsa_arctica.AAC.1
MGSAVGEINIFTWATGVYTFPWTTGVYAFPWATSVYIFLRPARPERPERPERPDGRLYHFPELGATLPREGGVVRAPTNR